MRSRLVNESAARELRDLIRLSLSLAGKLAHLLALAGWNVVAARVRPILVEVRENGDRVSRGW